jgi:hypothetical protein
MPTLTVHSDARPLAKTDAGAEIGIANRDAASYHIKAHWGTPVTLPAWQVVGADVCEHDRAWVEHQLATLLYDLGNSSLDAWIGARNAIRNSGTAAQEPKHHGIMGLAQGRPVVCVASGPTAAMHFDEIRQAQAGGAVIVCADTIYQPLAKAGIRPHVVCCIERIPCFTDIVVPEACPSTILVAPPIVDPSTVRGWEGRRVWYWQSNAGLYNWLGTSVPASFSGRSAGTLAAVTAILLGGSSLYLVGHDLCHVGGSSHAAGVHQLGPVGQAQLENEATPGSMFDVEQILCRDGERGRSNAFWRMCRDDIAAACSDYVGETYAVDMRGAAIPNTTAIDSIPQINGIPFPAIDALSLPIVTTNDRSNCLDAIRADHAAFMRVCPNGDLESLNIKEWASPDMAGLYAYVFGTIYHGASLRMHMRTGENWQGLARAILRRGIPATFNIMENDLC